MSLIIGFRATNSFFYPTINFDVFSLSEIVDFKSLILYSLFITAYPNVSVNHNFKCYLFQRNGEGFHLEITPFASDYIVQKHQRLEIFMWFVKFELGNLLYKIQICL